MGTCGVFMHDMVSHNAVTICSELQNTVLIHFKCLANQISIIFWVFLFGCDVARFYKIEDCFTMK